MSAKTTTLEERRAMRKRQDEQRKARLDAEWRMDDERRSRQLREVRATWDCLMERTALYETAETARQILLSLSPEALAVLRLWRLAEFSQGMRWYPGWQMQDEVRIAAGMKPKAFLRLITALGVVGALVPNDEGEFAYEHFESELLEADGLECLPSADRADRVLISLHGYRLNSALAELLTVDGAEP